VSPQAAAGVQPIVPVGNVEAVAYGEYSLAAALAAADVVQMVKVPAGAYITGITLAPDDLDTGTTITLSVGDGNIAARFISASTAAQTGAVVTLSVAAGMGFQYTVDDTIDITVAAGPSTATTGKLRLLVRYKMMLP
jgi:hypothetical protein